ncbi:MAG: hypothetical protein KGL97_14405, partial [Alphaproteobacteria bacterium]|nr:hypothetical protein [Alphaproteobacteria bacterium]
MVADSLTGKQTLRRSVQALVLAYLLVFAALIAVAGTIAVFGNPHAGEAVVQLDLALKRTARAAPPAAAALQPPPAQTAPAA